VSGEAKVFTIPAYELTAEYRKEQLEKLRANQMLSDMLTGLYVEREGKRVDPHDVYFEPPSENP